MIKAFDLSAAPTLSGGRSSGSSSGFFDSSSNPLDLGEAGGAFGAAVGGASTGFGLQINPWQLGGAVQEDPKYWGLTVNQWVTAGAVAVGAYFALEILSSRVKR